MKKIIIIITAISVSVASCSKKEEAFECHCDLEVKETSTGNKVDVHTFKEVFNTKRKAKKECGEFEDQLKGSYKSGGFKAKGSCSIN